MHVITNEEFENKVAHGTGEAFIWSNRLFTLDRFTPQHQDALGELIPQVMSSMGEKFDPENDMFVDMFYSAMGTEDITSSDIFIDLEDGTHGVIEIPTEFSWFPVKLLEGKKEGDTIDVVLPVVFNIFRRDPETGNIDERTPGQLHLTIRLNQMGSQFTKQMPFEDMLEQLQQKYSQVSVG